MPKTKQSVLINAPIEKVHRIVANFEAYPTYFPEVREAHILKESRTHPEVHFVFHVVTTINCHLKFSMSQREIKWTLIRGDYMQANDGEWLLESKGKDKTRATYKLEIIPSNWVPDAIIEELIIKNAPNMLMHLKERCEEGLAKKRPAVSRKRK